jgi:hypothetical protein
MLLSELPQTVRLVGGRDCFLDGGYTPLRRASTTMPRRPRNYEITLAPTHSDFDSDDPPPPSPTPVKAPPKEESAPPAESKAAPQSQALKLPRSSTSSARPGKQRWQRAVQSGRRI